MYLLDTNVISELRRGAKADPGVRECLQGAEENLYLPVQVIGELRYGIERLRRKGDHAQSAMLEAWLNTVLDTFSGKILSFDLSSAQIWGAMSAAAHQSAIDKQIAAIALLYDFTIVTRNTRHFAGTGARVLNPFLADATED